MFIYVYEKNGIGSSIILPSLAPTDIELGRHRSENEEKLAELQLSLAADKVILLPKDKEDELLRSDQRYELVESPQY
jgi:hypothetical protein